MRKKQTYLWLALGFLLGLAWLGLSSLEPFRTSAFGQCTLKRITGIPCPSCGATRAVKLTFSGQIGDALWMNPMGVLAAIGMVVLPCWLLFDIIFKRQTLYDTAQKVWRTLPIKTVLAIGFALLLANWVWNINKGL